MNATETVTRSERQREADAVALEGARIGQLARDKAEAANAEDTARIVAAGADQWSAESLVKACRWAAFTAAKVTRYQGDAEDIAAAVLVDALARLTQRGTLQARYCGCGRVAAVMTPAWTDDQGTAGPFTAAKCWQHRGTNWTRLPTWHVDRVGLPTADEVQREAATTVAATGLLDTAKGLMLNRIDRDPTAPAGITPKGRSMAQRWASDATPGDVADALAALTGKPTPKRVQAFLQWALQAHTLAAGRGTGRSRSGSASQGEIGAEFGWTEDTTKGEMKAARRTLAALLPSIGGVEALTAHARRSGAADLPDDLAAAMQWWAGAVARQRAPKTVERHRPLLRVTWQRRTPEGAALAPVTVIRPARSSYPETGPIRRRPLVVGAIRWQARRRTAERFTRLATLAARRTPDAAATIAAPRVYAMPTPVVPLPKKWKPGKPVQRQPRQAEYRPPREARKPQPETAIGARLARPHRTCHVVVGRAVEADLAARRSGDLAAAREARQARRADMQVHTLEAAPRPAGPPIL